MPEVALLELDEHAAEVLAADPEAFAKDRAITLTPSWPAIIEVATQTARFLATTRARTPWGGYLALEGPSRRLVGTCGFKGNPGDDGAVEIAYFTFPGDEGRGIATAMAEAMIGIAVAASPPPSLVRAHTLPEMNASCRVLEKAGLKRLGEVIDPEDGRVWRWERPLSRPG